MRLPYLQVTQDVFDVLAPAMSVLLEISEGDAVLHLLRLWKCLVDTGSEDRPPDGVIRGEKAAAIIERAVRWQGKPGAFIHACYDLSLDLIEAVPGGLRIRGAERYRRTWEKNRRRKPALFPPVTGDKPARQTQTQTQTHKEEREAPLFFAAPTPTQPNPSVRHTASDAATERPSSVPKPDTRAPAQAHRQGDGQELSLRDLMEGVWLKQHGVPYAWTFEDDTAMRSLLQKANGDTAAILLRWKRAVAWNGFPQCSSLKQLAQHWNAYAKDQPKPAEKHAGDRPRL